MVPSRAQLGESADLCTTRYGAALPSKETTVPGGIGEKFAVFRSEGFSVGVIFLGGVASLETFAKLDGSALSDQEKKKLLNADGPGEWIKGTNSAKAEFWVREDGAVARYNQAQRTLTLKSKKYVADQQAKILSDEKK